MRLVSIGFAFLLSGCALIGPVEPIGGVSKDLPFAAQQAQASINEANLALTAAANVITENVKEGIWTKDQAQGHLNRVKDYARRVDRAQELVRLGDFTKGKTEAEAVKALILILHREIAAQARKEAR